MRNQRRRILFPLLFCIIALLCGCAPAKHEESKTAESGSGIAVSEESSGENGTEEDKLRIGVTIYRYDDNFMKLYREELRQYLEETYGAEVVMRNARSSQEEQNRQIEEFIESGCDGIIVNLVDTKGANAVVDVCHEAGIPLVFINREAPDEEQKRWEEQQMKVASVGTDSRQAGTFQGEIILETDNHGDFNGDGTVSYIMIMGERGNKDTLYRTEYSIKALEAGGMKTEKLFTANGDWKQEEGRRLTERALELHGRKIEVVFCNNDAMANGALEAIEAAGRKVGRDIYLVGVDALEDTVSCIKDGRVTGTVLNDHTGQSHVAADVMVKMIQGEKVERRYLVDYVKITSISTFHKHTESEEE